MNEIEVAATSDKVPLTDIPRTAQEPTCGRIVHVYSAQWKGPLPGTVVRATGDTDGHPAVTLKVSGDSMVDGFAERTLRRVPVLDPMGGKVAKTEFWAEWMPFQAAQHAKQKVG